MALPPGLRRAAEALPGGLLFPQSTPSLDELLRLPVRVGGGFCSTREELLGYAAAAMLRLRTEAVTEHACEEPRNSPVSRSRGALWAIARVLVEYRDDAAASAAEAAALDARLVQADAARRAAEAEAAATLIAAEERCAAADAEAEKRCAAAAAAAHERCARLEAITSRQLAAAAAHSARLEATLDVRQRIHSGERQRLMDEKRSETALASAKGAAQLVALSDAAKHQLAELRAAHEAETAAAAERLESSEREREAATQDAAAQLQLRRAEGAVGRRAFQRLREMVTAQAVALAHEAEKEKGLNKHSMRAQASAADRVGLALCVRACGSVSATSCLR